MQPEHTILVLKHNGKEVGRIPATAPNAVAYCDEIGRHYKEVQIEYEYNQDAGLLAMLLGPRR